MNCWILCLPRSGSTFLCDLLNHTRKFQEFEDRRLKNNVGPIQRGRAFNEWLRIFENYHDLCFNPPSCCKAIYHQYIEVMSGVPISQRRSVENYCSINHERESFVKNKHRLNSIQSLFTSIKFLNLKRDVFEQTVSTYFARQTKKYHIYSEKEASEYFESSIRVDDNELIRTYEEIYFFQDAWEKMICRNNVIKEIYYEDLIQSPSRVILEVLDFLEASELNEQISKNAVVNFNREGRIIRMTRPESKKIISRLKSILGIKKSCDRILL